MEKKLNKEKEIEKMARAMVNCEGKRNDCKKCLLQSSSYYCQQLELAKILYEKGYGNVKQAVNDLWKQVKEVLEKYLWSDNPRIKAFEPTSTNDYICLDGDINNVFMKFLGID